jgi:hypothetical protein
MELLLNFILAMNAIYIAHNVGMSIYRRKITVFPAVIENTVLTINLIWITFLILIAIVS